MTRRAAERKGIGGEVPRYSLLGEAEPAPSGGAPDAEFIHVEDIPSRGALYRWRIPPHTHPGLFQLVLVTRGHARAHFDDSAAEMPPGTVIVVPPGCVHTFDFQPGTDGFVLTTTEATVSDGALDTDFARARVIDLRAGPGVAERVTSLLENIRAELAQPAIGPAAMGRARMLEWLIRALLLLLRRECARAGAPKGAAGARMELFGRFRALVEARYREHWTIPRYAAALGASESSLNRVCREAAGRSAFDVANDRLLLEAKRRLIYVAAPVAALAYELGFQDPAYFSRWFRRHAGSPPAAYRGGSRSESGPDSPPRSSPRSRTKSGDTPITDNEQNPTMTTDIPNGPSV